MFKVTFYCIEQEDILTSYLLRTKIMSTIVYHMLY